MTMCVCFFLLRESVCPDPEKRRNLSGVSHSRYFFAERWYTLLMLLLLLFDITKESEGGEGRRNREGRVCRKDNCLKKREKSQVLMALEDQALALLALSFAILGTLLALLNLSHQNRVDLVDIVPGLGRCLVVRAVPLGGPCCSLLMVYFTELGQICLVPDKNEWDL